MRFFYVYLLKSLRDGRWYIGSTHDLKHRLKLHNSGAVESTRARRPLQLIFYEAYLDEQDAKRRESYFKTSKGKSTLKVMLAQFLKSSSDPVPHQGTGRHSRPMFTCEVRTPDEQARSQ